MKEMRSGNYLVEEGRAMLKETHYQMTLCCETTAELVRLELLSPTWRMRDDLKRGAKRSKSMQPALAVESADIYGDPVTIIYLYYCPNCGKKVQVSPDA